MCYIEDVIENMLHKKDNIKSVTKEKKILPSTLNQIFQIAIV